MNTIHTLKQVFKIFDKYGNFNNEEFQVTSGTLYLGGPHIDDINQEDAEYLDNLMVFWSDSFECWSIET